MSMIEPAMADRREADSSAPPRTSRAPRSETPIIPRNSIAGRSLVAVVAIMTFLASLTTGAVVLVRSAAGEWQADVSREVTVQVRPVDGRDVEADLRKAADIVRAARGIAGVRPYTKQESAELLEPWLGSGLVLDDLPVPRLIVVRLAAEPKPDLAQLRRALSAEVPTASLDDHRGWVDKMRAMAGTAVAGGVLVLALMIAATVLSVAFATRGAMATNRPIIEVLHFVGAKDSFIARRFQGHFLMLGLRGGAIGGGAAILVFLVAQGLNRWFAGGAGEDELGLLFGRFSLGSIGYLMVAAQILVTAAVTAGTSRFTVNRTLRSVE